MHNNFIPHGGILCYVTACTLTGNTGDMQHSLREDGNINPEIQILSDREESTSAESVVVLVDEEGIESHSVCMLYLNRWDKGKVLHQCVGIFLCQIFTPTNAVL